MGADSEIQAEFPAVGRMYKSGRHEFPEGEQIALVCSGFDPTTGVTSKDVTIDPDNDVKARLFLPLLKNKKKLPILIYFHGGGFLWGSAFDKTNTRFLNATVSRTNVLAVSVDYRLAPLHFLPAAYNDAVTSLKWVFSPDADEWLSEYGDYEHVFIAGDSAGTNITHQVALLLEKNGLPKVEGVALLCPYFWGIIPIENETTDIFRRIIAAVGWIVVGAYDWDSPWMNPLSKKAPSLEGLGSNRAFVCVAEKDVLVWRGKAYYQGLKESGWQGEEAVLEEYKGVDHVWFINDPDSEQAKELMAQLASFFHKYVN